MFECQFAGHRELLKRRSPAVDTHAPAVINGKSVGNAIRIGLVGCGRRGTGAVSQALAADPHAEVIAVADVDEEQIRKTVTMLRKIGRISSQVKVEPHRQFVGIEAYRKVIECDVDLVLLATPPAFRPLHLAACVDAGKHTFCEKPVATDLYGVRSALQSVERAKAKDLCLMSGLCMRYHQTTRGMFEALSQRAIGRITGYHATYFGNSVKPMPPPNARPPAMADTEWQIRNWYNFVWLSGDGLVEQAIHSVDRISWAMNDQPPISCIGSGGCTAPYAEGNIYDHFSITYTFPGGVQAVLNSRQIDGCHNGIYDYIMGTEGTCTYGHGPFPIFHTERKSALTDRAKAAVDYIAELSEPVNTWLRNRSETDMYQTQQDALLAAIRNSKCINDGNQLATSTLLAIMGRTAAYTGQQITWDQVLKSEERLVPERIDWNGQLMVPPRAQPGLTRLLT